MTGPNSAFQIAVLPGDGIGLEVIASARAVLDALQQRIGGFVLEYHELAAGAACFQTSGVDISDEALKAAAAADAILLGAMGLPDIRYPDGTEISPHLRMRDIFQLYAGVRPVKFYPGTPSRLADPRAKDIDFVVLRESTEGLFASYGKGEVIDDREAHETLVITRATSEKLFDFAFRLAQRRKARGGKGLVTCVDKANVFRAMAFFRKIFTERAAAFPDIEPGYNYIDAQALDLIRRPWDFDVLVTENMYGDILSDLAGGLVGGMGMAPCAEIGDDNAVFQPSHGSAPDIVGQDKANPVATLLSAAMMLDWLGERHGVAPAVTAATVLQDSIDRGFASGCIRPMEFGGPDGMAEVTRTVINIVRTAN